MTLRVSELREASVVHKPSTIRASPANPTLVTIRVFFIVSALSYLLTQLPIPPLFTCPHFNVHIEQGPYQKIPQSKLVLCSLESRTYRSHLHPRTPFRQKNGDIHRKNGGAGLKSKYTGATILVYSQNFTIDPFGGRSGAEGILFQYPAPGALERRLRCYSRASCFTPTSAR